MLHNLFLYALVLVFANLIVTVLTFLLAFEQHLHSLQDWLDTN